MKKLLTLLSILIITLTSSIQAQGWEEIMKSKKAKLDVHYFENIPYAYKAKNGKLAGIEIDILNAFKTWLMEEKGVELELNYIPHEEFQVFFNTVATAPANSIGLGSVTITEERATQVKFSAPYLKNVSVLVTDGSVPTARTQETLKQLLDDLKPITIRGSIHESYLNQLYKTTATAPSEPMNVGDSEGVLRKMKESVRYFGYVDIISFWKYIKSNKDHYVKMHTMANRENEHFGFIFPWSTDLNIPVNEFFERGFGFTSTKAYHRILEEHLGFEIIERVELD